MRIKQEMDTVLGAIILHIRKILHIRISLAPVSLPILRIVKGDGVSPANGTLCGVL